MDLESKQDVRRRHIKQIVVFSVIIAVVIALYFVLDHYGLIAFFQSGDEIQEYIAGFGIWAPLAFFALQLIQVIITPIPGNVTTLAGGLLFGFWTAFIISTVAVCLGAWIVFALAKRYGRPLVIRLVKEETVDKYLKELSARQRQGLILMFLFPFFPDDTISLIAGLTPMRLREFMIITVLTRPWGLLASALIGDSVITVSMWGWVAIIVITVAAFAAVMLWGPKIEQKVKTWYKRIRSLPEMEE